MRCRLQGRLEGAKAPLAAGPRGLINIHGHAGAPGLSDSDLNVRYEPPRSAVSRIFTDLASATGRSRLEIARQLLSAPVTMVIDVESEVLPTQTAEQARMSNGFWGIFKPGSLTVRQIRLGASGRAMCQTRVT